MTSRSNNRERGKRGERDARDAVRRHWHAAACIRAAQANGTYSADLLHCDPHGAIHPEVKLRKALAVRAFMDQAERDSRGGVPVVLMREDGGGWLVMFPIEQTARFVNALREQIPTA